MSLVPNMAEYRSQRRLVPNAVHRSASHTAVREHRGPLGHAVGRIIGD